MISFITTLLGASQVAIIRISCAIVIDLGVAIVEHLHRRSVDILHGKLSHLLMLRVFPLV